MQNTAIKQEKAIALVALANNRYAVIDAHNNTKIDFESKALAKIEFEKKRKLYRIK